MNIDPTFFDVFAAYFNVDSLEPDNRQQLRDLAYATASTLKKKVADLDALSAGLSDFLRTWDRKVIMELIKFSNVDWLADKEEEDSLKLVISEIIKYI